MKAFLAVIGFLALMVASSIWRGYVLSVAWGWFVAPTFSVPRLGVVVAIGLTATVRLVTYQHIEDESEKKPLDQRWDGIFVRSFVVPGFMLFFCWIVKHWM